jgi:hypothetical protein
MQLERLEEIYSKSNEDWRKFIQNQTKILK